MAVSNGSKGVVLWIASGLAVIVGGLGLFLLTTISTGLSENRSDVKDHAERLRAVEIIGEQMQDDISEIKVDVKSIGDKIDRALK